MDIIMIYMWVIYRWLWFADGCWSHKNASYRDII